MKRPLGASLAGLLLIALWPARALADVAPRDAASCAQKKPHDPCAAEGQAQGSCEPSTCTHNDYSQGVPPKSVTVDCLKCQPSAQPPKKSGCSVGPEDGLALGLLGWLVARRRR